MIRNERQLKITRKRIRDFQSALAPLKQSQASQPELKTRMQIDALETDLARLNLEVEEYEQLKAGAVQVLVADSFDRFPDLMIKARIARNLTQRQLAEKLNLKEQQVQRYESSNYASASVSLLRRVIAALDLDVEEKATLKQVESAEPKSSLAGS